MPQAHYTVVALRDNNEVGNAVRDFTRWTDALGYLLHNLPRRPNLDLVDSAGQFVSWEFEPTTIG